LLETSVVSTVIGSLGGTADERLVDTDSSAWDSSLAPKTDWDTILDGCKRGLDQTLNINVRKESFPDGGFPSYISGCLAFRRLVCNYCWSSWGLHQLL